MVEEVISCPAVVRHRAIMAGPVRQIYVGTNLSVATLCECLEGAVPFSIIAGCSSDGKV
jgi:hypothetical protein